MARLKSDELGKQAAAWLATCFTLAGGTLACLTLAILFLEEPLLPLVRIVGISAVLSLVFWLLRTRHENRSRVGLIAWLIRAQDSANHVVAMRVSKKPTAVPVHYGTNTPPSAEELRELADDTRTWVPRETRPETD